jgi:hypothetical protein
MKKKIRRLHLNRETVRHLTPQHLATVAGGLDTSVTCYNSCNTAEVITTKFEETRFPSICNSCLETCATCNPNLCC